MSKVLSGVAKIFKKVAKVALKIAPYVIAVGAVVLTAGAALGALPAVGAMVGSLGLSAGVTAALTSAVTTAAIGTAVGAAGAAATGGNILKGAAMGGVAGFAAGGIAGALAPAAVGAGAPAASAGLADASTAAGTMSLPAIDALGPIAAPAAAAPAAGGGILGSLGKTLTSPTVVGGLIQGVGSGISGNEASKAAAKAGQANRDFITANYQTHGSGLLGAADAAQPVNDSMVAPSDKFDPFVYGGQFRTDPTTGKLVYVPRAQMQGA